MTKIQFAIILLLLSLNVGAAELSPENLVGEWEFLTWAETESPQETHAVGIVMDFQPDGNVISEVSGKDVTESYRIDGDTIIYAGKRGEQVWKLVALVPGESLVVNNSGTIMTFKRK